MPSAPLSPLYGPSPPYRAPRKVSLKDQCYQHRFYGPTDQLEDNLATLESHIAPVLQAIQSDKTLPPSGENHYEMLLIFVALQLLRTTAAAARVNASVDKMTKQVFSRDTRLEGIDMDSVHFGYDHPVLMSLSTLEFMVSAIADLKAHLVLADNGTFITSDNPVFRYDQYCEGAHNVGTTGGLNRGLQLFLPLSPSALLLLYDGSVYKVGDRTTNLVSTSIQDIERLNMMQLISAVENVYFSDWKERESIQYLAPRAERHRNPDPTRVLEYMSEDNENHSLLHLFEHIPNLKLNLSFLTIRRNARRLPLYKRLREYRKPLPIPDPPVPPHLRGRMVRYSRPRGSGKA